MEVAVEIFRNKGSLKLRLGGEYIQTHCIYKLITVLDMNSLETLCQYSSSFHSPNILHTATVGLPD